jgi:hypothetical protein
MAEKTADTEENFIPSGTGEEFENIEAHHISIFLYGAPPEFLDGKVMKVEPSLRTFEFRTVQDEPVYRGVYWPA